MNILKFILRGTPNSGPRREMPPKMSTSIFTGTSTGCNKLGQNHANTEHLFNKTQVESVQLGKTLSLNQSVQCPPIPKERVKCFFWGGELQHELYS